MLILCSVFTTFTLLPNSGGTVGVTQSIIFEKTVDKMIIYLFIFLLFNTIQLTYQIHSLVYQCLTQASSGKKETLLGY